MNVKETLEDLGYHVTDYGNQLLAFHHGDFIIKLEKLDIDHSDDNWYMFKKDWYVKKINSRNVKDVIDSPF